MNNIFKSPTFRLFSIPSYWEGIKCTFDLYGDNHHYNLNKKANDVDLNAIQSDWEAIGRDLQDSMELVRKEVLD